MAGLAGLAGGTPLYAGRAGRTCDNCHLTPNDWVNPGLAERKCSLSCQTCHVDPAGGGLRNAGGRFYTRSTLPMRATGPRPTQDWDRRWFGLLPRWDTATTYTHDLPQGPATLEESRDPRFAPHDIWGLGTPAGHPIPGSLFQGRHEVLNSDPLFRVGWDLRFAALVSDRSLAFPMQADLGLALHPVERLTLYTTIGARGRSEGLSATTDDPQTPYLRDAVLLLHELPYMLYVKAGRFVPVYGLRLDDHTSFIRRRLELDNSVPESRVTGVEIGASPNYPFVHLSWFKSKAEGVPPDPWDIFDVDESWGVAASLGYRAEGWNVGGSFMNRERPLEEGGNSTTYGLFAGLNIWRYVRNLPLTYHLEFDHRDYTRRSGRGTEARLFYQELDWLAGNGLNFLVKHDWEDPDREVRDDEADRLAFGVQITPVPGLMLDTRYRVLFPQGGQTDSDLFLQLHFWN